MFLITKQPEKAEQRCDRAVEVAHNLCDVEETPRWRQEEMETSDWDIGNEKNLKAGARK